MKTKLSWCLGAISLGAGLLLAPGASAVAVYGEASSDGPTVTVRVFADLTNAPVISFAFRLLYNPQALYVVAAAKNTEGWYFSDGTNRLAYQDPDLSTLGEVLILGGKLDALSPLQGVLGPRILLGTVTFGRWFPNVPQFSLALGHPAPFANFTTTTGSVLDTSQPGIVFQAVTPDPTDTNLNGLADAWERRYFGVLGRFEWNDDPDQDGFNNQQEQALGSDPTDPTSNLRLSISLESSGVQLRWTSFSNHLYQIQSSPDLREFWPFESWIPATPPTNQYLIRQLDNAAFFRVLLQPPQVMR